MEPKYLIVTGKGRTRKVIASFYSRQAAVMALNVAILDGGLVDARLVTRRTR